MSSDQSRERIYRAMSELPKHALLSVILATFLLLQVEVLIQLDAAEKHMDLIRKAGPLILLYGVWPLIDLVLDFSSQLLSEHVFSRFKSGDRAQSTMTRWPLYIALIGLVVLAIVGWEALSQAGVLPV